MTHPLISDNPRLAHLAAKIDAMHVAKDGSRHPSKDLADLKDAGNCTRGKVYGKVHMAHMMANKAQDRG